MNSHKIVAALVAATLALGSISALAQPRESQRQHNRGDGRGEGRGGIGQGHREENRGDNRGDNRYDNRNDNRNDNRGGNHSVNRADNRGAGPDHSFYRGGRLPAPYRGHQYVVDDWRGHHLNAPPRGYHWVQTGGDYVLVAIATGIIASILLNQ